MSDVILEKPVMLDETGKAIVDALNKLNPSVIGYKFTDGENGSFTAVNQSDGIEVTVNTLPQKNSADAGKALIVNQDGSGYVYGEAGKVDDVQLNGQSIVNEKIANIVIQEASASNAGLMSSSDFSKLASIDETAIALYLGDEQTA